MSGADLGALLADAARRGVDRFDAQCLLSLVLERPRAWLLAHDDHRPDAEQRARFDDLIARRVDGEPVAYLVGAKEFHGLAFEVDPAVLVPRPDTELLVDWAIECVGADGGPSRALAVVDLGTGSGAVAVAVALRCPLVAMTAVDVSEHALRVAARNGARHGVAIDWRRGSWWEPLAGRRFDLALANPPYIACGDAHLAALRHEPALALVAGADGLDALRIVIGGAGRHLLPGGWLLVEHGFDQAARVRSLFAAAGFAQVQSRLDAQQHERCTAGRWPG